MTADGTAALVVAIIAAAIGAGGLVVGVIGLVQASRAHTTAKSAAVAAKDANDLSGEANFIAREANEISRRADEKAHERHDVKWDADLVDDGVLEVRNVGRDTAYKVLIRVTFDQGPALDVEVPEVPGRTGRRIQIPAVKTQLGADRREDAVPMPSGVLWGGPIQRMYRLDVEVSWSSESGRAYSDKDVGGTYMSLEPSQSDSP